MKAKILLAEDDETLREQWAAALEHEHLDVSQSEGIRETLYRFCLQSPDLAIFSLNLPSAERTRVLSLMNQFEPGCPIIAITPESEVDLQAPPPARLVAQLQKPVEPARLVETVKALLGALRPELLQMEDHPEKESHRRARTGGRHYRKKTTPLPQKAAGQ